RKGGGGTHNTSKACFLVYLFFGKVNKNLLHCCGPTEAESAESEAEADTDRPVERRTVDDGRAKCSWPRSQMSLHLLLYSTQEQP
ncbi:hypothetical protein M0802_015882, partial [Mischocyttarus mexicanus]